MFLVNSRYPRFSATPVSSGREVHHPQGHTFSRSYGVILPSSLGRVLSSALGSSPRPPVSVCGTVTTATPAGAFLGSMGLPSSWGLGPLLMTSRIRASSFVPLGVLKKHPTGLNRTIHVSARLPSSVPPAFVVSRGGAGILTCFPSPTPFGLGLGAD